jgi:hypothetical protein
MLKIISFFLITLFALLYATCMSKALAWVNHFTQRGGSNRNYSAVFSDNTRVRILIFFMTKTLNQIFFSSTKIRIFFSATWGISIFFLEKKHIENCLKVYVPNQDNEWPCSCVLHLSTILIYGLGTVPTVWYYLAFILFKYVRSILHSRNAMCALNLISTLSSIIQRLDIECVCCVVIDKEGKTELYEE